MSVISLQDQVSKKKLIRLFNDTLRTKGKGGKTIMTSGVMSSSDIQLVLKKVKEFNDFNQDNDPYNEHDFGKVECNGTDYFWKIDYYDRDFKYHSPDKSNPFITNRVLTIMKASEY